MILMTLKLNYIVNEHFFPMLSIFTLRDFVSNSRLINIHLLFGLPFGQYTLSLTFHQIISCRPYGFILV